MALQLSAKPELKPGVYDGRVQAVIEMGTHSKVYDKERKPPNNEIKLVFELYDGDNLFYIGRDYTMTFSQKSDLPKVLAAIYRDAKDVKSRLAKEGASTELLGMPASITVGTFNKDGKDINYIAAVNPIDKRVLDQVPAAVKEGVVFEFSRPDAVEVFKTKLTGYTRDKIMRAENSSFYPVELHTAYKDMQEDTAATKTLG